MPLTGPIKYHIITYFGISVVGVYHAGGHKPWERGYGGVCGMGGQAMLHRGPENTCNVGSVRLTGDRRRSSARCRLGSIMHELTGAHFVLAGVKLGTAGG